MNRLLKIKYKDIILGLLLLDFLISIHFFYTYALSWAGYYRSAIYVIIYVLMSKKKSISPVWLKNYVKIFAIVVAFETVFSIIAYNQDVLDVLKISLGYLQIIGAFVYYMYFNQYEKYDSFLDRLVKMIILMQALLLLQALLYNFGFKNIVFLNALFGTGDDGLIDASRIRNGMLRCGQFNKIVYIIYFWALFSIFKRRVKKQKHILCVVLTLVSEIYVGQTRGSYSILIVSSLLVILTMLWNKKYIIIDCILLGILFFSLLFFGLGDFISNNLAISGDGNVQIRLDAISYYMGRVLNSPLFGMGFIYPVQGARYDLWYILYGPDLLHPYVYSDIGIFGQIAKFGLCVYFTHFVLLKRIVNITKTLFKQKNENFYFLLGCTAYIFGTLVTLVFVTDEIPYILGIYSVIYTDCLLTIQKKCGVDTWDK